MLLGVKLKQPDETLDYDVLYNEWFGLSTDTIDSVTVSVNPSGGMTATASNPDDTKVKIWCAGGTDGDVYTVEVTMTSVAGRVKQDEIEIRIQEF